tara:strand:- start:2359 stop:3531 length:1173 start_codon:yes stop_codon:yes gene_type:complete
MLSKGIVRFNSPYITGKEIDNLKDLIKSKKISGNGIYTKKCSSILENYLDGSKKVLITHSCTAALEMAAILLNIKKGDEVIMPSYTFVSTANAFVLRGGIPVFIDIKNDDLNLNEELIRKAITKKTKAIIVVHYGGLSCDMSKIIKIAKEKKIALIEDAAQALGSEYKGKKLGTLGDLASISFHETKNIIGGEGGALIVNNSKYLKRSEIVWEKGTNRNSFFNGATKKYTWLDIGSSYLPSELVSAFLLDQLKKIDYINSLRMEKWKVYRKLFDKLFIEGLIKIQKTDSESKYNAHIFYILVKNQKLRDLIIKKLNNKQISAVFHYIPLHSSPAGKKYGKSGSSMRVTNKIYKQIIRLPLYPNISEKTIYNIFSIINKIIRSQSDDKKYK